MATAYKPPHLLLHTLVVSLSYWGTAVRLLLIGFVLFFASLLAVLDVDTTMSFQSHAAQFIYLLGSLFLLDAGYVTIARSLPFTLEIVDQVFFVTLMFSLSLVIVLPYFAAVPDAVYVSNGWVFLVALFVLSIRLVLGLFFGHRK